MSTSIREEQIKTTHASYFKVAVVLELDHSLVCPLNMLNRVSYNYGLCSHLDTWLGEALPPPSQVIGRNYFLVLWQKPQFLKAAHSSLPHELSVGTLISKSVYSFQSSREWELEKWSLLQCYTILGVRPPHFCPIIVSRRESLVLPTSRRGRLYTWKQAC